MFLNPGWNHFIGVLNFPFGPPLTEISHNLLQGPYRTASCSIEAVRAAWSYPARKMIIGSILWRTTRRVVFATEGVSLEASLEYGRFATHLEERSDAAQYWLMSVGMRCCCDPHGLAAGSELSLVWA